MDAKLLGMEEASTRTTQPIVTGTSVLAVKYKGGVMIMADTLGSYGNLCRYKNLERIKSVNDFTLIAAGGEYSDFQYICKLLEQLAIEDFCEDDGAKNTPRELHCYLGRVLYNRRSKQDPLWNSVVVGGFHEGKSFLGAVDLLGSCYEEDVLATGMGQHMALPILRKGWKEDLSEEDAKKLLEEAMTVLIYRDCNTINRFQIARVTKDGPEVSPPYALKTYWEHKLFVTPGGEM